MQKAKIVVDVYTDYIIVTGLLLEVKPGSDLIYGMGDLVREDWKIGRLRNNTIWPFPQYFNFGYLLSFSVRYVITAIRIRSLNPSDFLSPLRKYQLFCHVSVWETFTVGTNEVRLCLASSAVADMLWSPLQLIYRYRDTVSRICVSFLARLLFLGT